MVLPVFQMSLTENICSSNNPKIPWPGKKMYFSETALRGVL